MFHLAEAVKKVAKVPVIGVGKITEMDMAEKFLQQGKADIIYMGRQLIADPETQKKFFEGQSDEIRKCLACLRWEGFQNVCGRPCAVNYDVQDGPIPLAKADKKKKVLVVGDGVGGMEAARIAGLRGHDVTLMEKEPVLGGIVQALAMNPLEASLGNIVDYQAAQLKKLGVNVRVCKEVVAKDVDEFQPDVVIVATGATMVRPEVTKGKPGVMTYVEATRKRMNIGQKVVIWGLSAAELAVSLAQEGTDVILMGRGDEAALAPERDARSLRRIWLLRRLTDDLNIFREHPETERLPNAQVLFNTDVLDIIPEGVQVLYNKKSGEKNIIPYDTLIVSLNREQNVSLYDELKDKVSDIHKIGDCENISDIKEAIFTANEIVRKI